MPGWVTSINSPQLVSATGVRSLSGSKGNWGLSARFMTRVLTLTNKVLPSGAARTTASVPMLPEAPTRFSTTTARLSFCDNLGPNCRATMSMPVPGVNGTIKRKAAGLL